MFIVIHVVDTNPKDGNPSVTATRTAVIVYHWVENNEEIIILYVI